MLHLGFHSFGAVPVTLICLFSSRVLRYCGTSTKLASTILPSLANSLAVSSTSLKILNKPKMTFLFMSYSRKFQNILLSGTLSLFFKPRKRLKFALSTIWYSNWSSDRLYKLWISKAYSIISLLNGGHPPLDAPFNSSVKASLIGALKIFQSMYESGLKTKFLKIFESLLFSSSWLQRN